MRAVFLIFQEFAADEQCMCTKVYSASAKCTQQSLLRKNTTHFAEMNVQKSATHIALTSFNFSNICIILLNDSEVLYQLPRPISACFDT